MGYVPSAAARAMRGDTWPILGLVLPNLLNEFYARLADALAREGEAAGLHVAIDLTNDDGAHEDRALARLEALNARAVLRVPAPGSAPRAPGRDEGDRLHPAGRGPGNPGASRGRFDSACRGGRSARRQGPPADRLHRRGPRACRRERSGIARSRRRWPATGYRWRRTSPMWAAPASTSARRRRGRSRRRGRAATAVDHRGLRDLERRARCLPRRWDFPSPATSPSWATAIRRPTAGSRAGSRRSPCRSRTSRGKRCGWPPNRRAADAAAIPRFPARLVRRASA